MTADFCPFDIKFIGHVAMRIVFPQNDRNRSVHRVTAARVPIGHVIVMGGSPATAIAIIASSACPTSGDASRKYRLRPRLSGVINCPPFSFAE
jgi:hypothetical protein